MQTKHTPGLWTAEAKDLGGEVPSWRVYNDPEGQEVARVHRWNGKEDEANARLIAAAPDLLDALTDLIGGCGKEGDLFSSTAMDKARAAIEKANTDITN